MVHIHRINNMSTYVTVQFYLVVIIKLIIYIVDFRPHIIHTLQCRYQLIQTLVLFVNYNYHLL